MWWEQDYPLGEFEKSKFALFHPEFFDSKIKKLLDTVKKIWFWSEYQV